MSFKHLINVEMLKQNFKLGFSTDGQNLPLLLLEINNRIYASKDVLVLLSKNKLTYISFFCLYCNQNKTDRKGKDNHRHMKVIEYIIRICNYYLGN